jgi:subfamily B ATP-binding cassette protein MsbA
MIVPTGAPGRLLASYARRLSRRIAGLCALALVSSGLMAVQPVLIAAILALVLGTALGGGSASSLFDLNHLGGRFLASLGVAGGTVGAVLLLGALYVGHALISAALEYVSGMTAMRLRAECARLIQHDLLRHVVPQGLGFFHRERAGELLSRFSLDAVNAGQGLGPVVRVAVSSGAQILVYGAYLVYTDPWLTAGAVLLFAMHFGLSQALRVPLFRRTRASHDVVSDFAATLQETLTTVRVAKSFGAERWEMAKVGERIDRVTAASMAEGRVKVLEAPMRSVLDAAAIIGILVIAVARMGAGALTAQGLLLYLFVGRQIILPINAAATAYLFTGTMSAAFARVAELLGQEGRLRDGATVKTGFDDRIEFRDVSFSYGDNVAVDRVSFTIEKGEMVALVGPSGAGKSTITDLLLRLYDPARGAVLVDGVDVRDLRQAEYRRLFGVVPQETLLFHDTIRNNIRYGRDDLDEDAIRAAARMAYADDFIRALPDDYDTVVGDRGVRLSGGERQRVAVARAIAHHPQILILDEATSAVDTESERQLQEAIEGLVKSTTTLVIAHRLSTVARADRIIVIANGGVVDSGRHEELLARCELYQRLCRLQFDVDAGAVETPR